jgi:hypothetical protein
MLVDCALALDCSLEEILEDDWLTFSEPKERMAALLGPAGPEGKAGESREALSALAVADTARALAELAHQPMTAFARVPGARYGCPNAVLLERTCACSLRWRLGVDRWERTSLERVRQRGRHRPSALSSFS